jgi:hypothetical protein
LEKQTSTPLETSVRTKLSAPFILVSAMMSSPKSSLI